MDVSYTDVETIFRVEDIEGLIEMGAPDDEYDSEAKEIFDTLKGFGEDQFTEDNIVAVISRVWKKMFDLDENDISKRMPAFKKVALDLLSI